MKIYLMRAKYSMINDAVRVYKNKEQALKSAQNYVKKFGAIKSSVFELILEYEEFTYTGDVWRWNNETKERDDEI